ncbi:MAG: hypothetical protein ACYSU0_19005 [Planctomycetota bacterium]
MPARAALITAAALLPLGCGTSQHTAGPDAYRLVRRLRNSDIEWDGNLIGLWPSVNGEVARQLLDLGPEATKALVGALADPERFAAAHVLLTKIGRKEHGISASEWNGLRVTLHADGTEDLHPDQIESIRSMWAKER